MWTVLAAWITVAVVVPILIGIGMGVLSMNPPEFTTAHICFTFSAAILMIRLGWWLAFEQSASRFQLILFAFIAFGIIGSLWLVSIKWINQREQEFVASTKTAIIQPKQPTAEEIATEVVKRIPGLSPESKKSEPTTFKEKVEKVVVSLGGGGFSSAYSFSSLQNGAVEPFNFGNYKPIRVYLDQGRLFADVSIYGGHGQSPIEVKHNDFIVRVPGWDRNFDSTALEVVNNANSPVFQLIYRTPYRIIINGIFPSPAGLMLASDDGFWQSMPSIPKSFRILRLFKYPSHQFPGQREEAQRIIPRPKLKEQAINLSEELINFANEREKMLLNAIQRGEGGKIGSETASLYDEKFALKCADVAEEIAASGINVGKLPSLCRGANNTMVMKEVANQLKTLANLLP